MATTSVLESHYGCRPDGSLLGDKKRLRKKIVGMVVAGLIIVGHLCLGVLTKPLADYGGREQRREVAVGRVWRRHSCCFRP